MRRAKTTASTGARSYGCVKCGHTYTAYPPDDVHVVARRIKSPFLEEIRVDYVCSRCKEVLPFYWGKPIAGMDRLLAFAKTLRKSKDDDEEETDQPIEDASSEDVDKTVYDYIESNNGKIQVNKAAKDLEIPPDVIEESIQRLSLAGKLTPPD